MHLPVHETSHQPLVETRNAHIHKSRVVVGPPENEEEKNIVIKEWKWIKQREREPGESDEQYYARRMEDSVKYIRKERESQRQAVEFLSAKGIKAPLEHFVIVQDDDGFPYPVKLQEFLSGVTLSQRSPEEWTDTQTMLVYNILLAN